MKNKITSAEFKKTFNPRNIIADPSLLGDTFVAINTHNLRAKFDTITKNTQNIDDFLFFCYFEDGELCCSYGNTTNRYIFKLDLKNEESFNKIPGYEVISPAMNLYYKQYLL